MTLVPEWAKTMIWWSVYPLGACGAPIREPDSAGVHHRLSRLESWLDYLIDLGCNGLALGPIWASSTHGYDIIDHCQIDPRLGDDSDFDSLISACHSRGIRVLLDGVFNHVSRESSFVREVVEQGWQTPGGQLLRHDPNDPQGLSRFEGHDGLVELDHSHEQVADYVVHVMNHWLDRGADGWRLDAAYRVPVEFWSEVLGRVQLRHPQYLSVAEILHGDYPSLVDRAGFGSITQYELWKAIWSSLKDNNPHELNWSLLRHGLTRHHGIPWTFVSNHDVTRIATQIGPPAAKVAMGIMMSLPGMPAIYYGDELGFMGLKEDGWSGDDAIRPALNDHPGGFSNEADKTRQVVAHLIRIRRLHPWIVDSALEILSCHNHEICWECSGDNQWMRVTVTMESENPTLSLSTSRGEAFTIG